MIVRVGVAASRSVGNAVERNRVKRRIRAGIDPIISVVRPGWNLIFLARKTVLVADFGELQSAILTLIKRAGLLVEEGYGTPERLPE
jgi:ribonuclease P protein component